MTVRFVATLIVVLCAHDAFAWNALGHKTVAEIAWRQLTPEQRQPICLDQYLAHVKAVANGPLPEGERQSAADFVAELEATLERAENKLQTCSPNTDRNC